MSITLKPGLRLRAPSSTAEVIVVRIPTGPVELAIDDVALTDEPTEPPAGVPESTGPAAIELGKRYVDDATGIELLCARAGTGTLSCNGNVMVLRSAKPLPSSD
jgi:hypothetical protein